MNTLGINYSAGRFSGRRNKAMCEHHYTATDPALTNIAPDNLVFPANRGKSQAKGKDWTPEIIKLMRSKSGLRLKSKGKRNG